MEITRTSLLSGETRTRDLPITPEQWAAFEAGQHIQQALAHLSDGDREFILTGSTEEEWDEEFAEDDEDEDDGCCPACGAAPGFSGVECEVCAEEEANDPALAARAKTDLDAYCATMMQPNGWRGCLVIEKRWGLDGYSPEAVTAILQRVAAGGVTPEQAEIAVLAEAF